jgi:hypothetical protein
MPRLDTVLVMLLAMPAASFANNDAIPNSREIRADRRQLAADVDWNERDAREVAEFERFLGSLRDAGRDRMTGRYREVNTRVQTAMTREIEQAQVKSAQAAHDANLSRREWRGERMDASVGGEAYDVLQARDDRRDLRDNARDRDNTLARYEEMARVATMSAALQNPIERGDRRAMKRNLELTEMFLALMRRDLAATRTEWIEDRVELREDVRDSRREGQ